MLCLAILCLGLPSQADTTSTPLPNFVVIILDDWGAGDAGVYGNSVLKTPNIDGLAHRGMRFDNAFLSTSSCSASRISILSSRYPSNTGAPNLHDSLPDSTPIITDVLRQHGYFTASIGKYHLGGHNTHHRFDLVKDPTGASGAEDWLETIKQLDPQQPFFLWLGSKDPHVPWDPLTEKSVYQASDIPEVSPFMVDSQKSRINIAQYYNELVRVDAYIGAVIKTLENNKLIDNTYIILLSDNGAPFPRAKTTLYDSGIKTPLIISGPGIQHNSTNQNLISSVDLIPTLLDLANLSQLRASNGIPFTKMLFGSTDTIRNYIYAEQYDHGYPINRQAIRTSNHLYIRNNRTEGWPCLLEAKEMREELVASQQNKTINNNQLWCLTMTLPQEELYKTSADPLSLTNLIDSLWMLPTRWYMQYLLINQNSLSTKK